MEEIIIDGVDVSGCHCIRQSIIPDNEGCKIYDDLCCDHLECMYKQLKRKEKEYEELKEKCKLKLIMPNGRDVNSQPLMEETEVDLLEVIGNLVIENNKLKQALQEIKEIAQKYDVVSGDIVIVHPIEDLQKILQIISEVE